MLQLRTTIDKKPPYRIPLMEEIAALPKNGLRFVSTFSGCGGSCLGFKMAGWTPIFANEFIPAAQEVYRLNNPEVPLSPQDIRDVEPAALMEYLGLDQGELDVLEGSPPCASFSTAGKRSAGWGEVRKYSDSSQRVDDLFFEYVRLLRGLRPKAFVAENVTGLVKGVAKGYFKEIHKQLAESGYRVNAMILDAQWLGVPQARQRVIFCGVRSDLGLQPPTVTALPYRYTVRDAIPLAVRVGTAPPHADWTAAGRDVANTMVSAETEPAPTIVASGENKGAGWVEVRVPVRVIHDTSGAFSKGDVTDRPCPTITVGSDGMNSVHYVVEEKVVRIPVDVIWTHYGRDKGSVSERPSPTITGHGVSGGNDDTLGVEFVEVDRATWDDAVARCMAGEESAQVAIVDPESRLGRAVGAEWDKLGPGDKSAKYLNLVRPHPDEPCPTVTAIGGTGAASVTHPIERRKFTIPELRRICGFPDDFQLVGNYRQQWERLGRSVPPPMMKAVAAALAEQVFDR